MIHRLYYAWLDQRRGVYRISLYPPDAPIRPSIEMESKAAVIAWVERKRGRLMWIPELPLDAR
jgi:hypothetical protein